MIKAFQNYSEFDLFKINNSFDLKTEAAKPLLISQARCNALFEGLMKELVHVSAMVNVKFLDVGKKPPTIDINNISYILCTKNELKQFINNLKGSKRSISLFIASLIQECPKFITQLNTDILKSTGKMVNVELAWQQAHNQLDALVQLLEKGFNQPSNCQSQMALAENIKKVAEDINSSIGYSSFKKHSGLPQGREGWLILLMQLLRQVRLLRPI